MVSFVRYLIITPVGIGEVQSYYFDAVLVSPVRYSDLNMDK